MDGATSRFLEPADAENWLRIRIRAVREHPTAFLMTEEEESSRSIEDIAKMLGRPRADAFILGAFAGAEIVGTVGVARAPQKKCFHSATLWGMYVAPEARRGGVGRLLLEAAISSARAMPGLERVCLSVDSLNPAARRLYEAHGFVFWGREPDAFRTAERAVDEEHMVLRLS
jgi:ribosomal protein S18 acetylase RimI-like enzyme